MVFQRSLLEWAAAALVMVVWATQTAYAYRGGVAVGGYDSGESSKSWSFRRWQGDMEQFKSFITNNKITTVAAPSLSGSRLVWEWKLSVGGQDIKANFINKPYEFDKKIYYYLRSISIPNIDKIVLLYSCTEEVFSEQWKHDRDCPADYPKYVAVFDESDDKDLSKIPTAELDKAGRFKVMTDADWKALEPK